MRGGIDLGGTKIQAVVIDESDSVAGQARRSTPRDGGPADVADAIAEALEEAAKAAGGTPAALTGIGVGSPGTVNEATGTVANARNLRNWTNRSEEHTSELQSQSNLVCRLLLEKKTSHR